MASTKQKKLLRKLEVLKKGATSVKSSNGAKNKDERKQFWSELMMNEAEKTGDRIKASELLGRSEADFTDKLGLGAIGEDGEIKEIPIRFVEPIEKPVLVEGTDETVRDS